MKQGTKPFNANTTLGEVMKKCERAEEILTGFGMHCFFCPISQQETLEEAAEVHGIDLQLLLEKLNEVN